MRLDDYDKADADALVRACEDIAEGERRGRRDLIRLGVHAIRAVLAKAGQDE